MSKKPTNAVVGRSRLSCVVENSVLGTLVQVLTDHRVCQMEVRPYEEPPSLVLEGKMTPELEKSLANMKRFGSLLRVEETSRKRSQTVTTPTSETRLGSLILSILRASKEPMTSVQVGREIEKHSYKLQSASPCLSDLAKEKAVLCDRSVRQRYLYSLPMEKRE